MTRIFQHIDGVRPDNRHDGLIRLLQEKYILDPLKDKDKPSFCGLVCLDDEVHFFWPKTSPFRSDEKSTFRYGRLLLGTMKKYSMRPADNESGDENTEVSGIPPLAALDILQDYLVHGLYTNTRSLVVRKSSGNIVWSRVIRRSTPFPDNEGRPVYTDLFVRKPDYFAENEISSIHEAVIAELDRAFGWYFSDDGSVAPELAGSEMPFTVNKAIALLKKELASVFSDREIRLLRNLLSFLEKKNAGSENNLLFSGIRNFEHVWEVMCGHLYGNQKAEFTNRIPYPAYMIDGVVIPSERNSQRMDIIIRENDNVAVLDAKYYDLSKTKPEWADLVKQFYYARSLAASMPDKNISNHFVCPRPAEPPPEDLPDKAVILDPADNSRMDAEFRPVNIVYHDISEVMESYIAGEPSIALRYIVVAA